MDAERFNELIELQKYDKAAKREFCRYCLAVIKHRVMFRCASDHEDISHDILKNFLAHLPKFYVSFPHRYIDKSVDNFLSNRKKKEQKTVTNEWELDSNETVHKYEQRFDKLNKIEVYNILVKVLGEENGNIFYMYCIDRAKEYEIAEAFNLSYPALRKRISRSKEKLRNFFGSKSQFYQLFCLIKKK